MTKPLIGITASSIEQRGSAFGEVYVLTRKYAEGVLRAGGVPVIVPYNLDAESLQILFDRLDGLLLSGGGDIDPAIYGEAAHQATNEIEVDRDRVELALARWVVEQEKPFLAICRGIQVLNVALGGTLIQDIPSEVPDALEHSFERGIVERGYHAHPVKIAADSRLADVMQTEIAQTNSWHHQAIKQAAPKLNITAYAPDGVIEAVEVPGRRFAIGVQWHPEWMFEDQPEHRRLFEGLVGASANAADEAFSE
jgi:putative glutamine amidotransferase